MIYLYKEFVSLEAVALRDYGDSIFAERESLGVPRGIETDDLAVGNRDVLVDDAVFKPDIFTDPDVAKDHRIRYQAAVADENVLEQHRVIDVGARDNRSAGTGVMYSRSSGLNTDQPSRKCLCSEWDLYWVSTSMRRSPECRQLLRVKSIIRYLPPKGTAGFARYRVSGCSRSPAPPARMIAKMFFSMRDVSEL